LIKFHSFNFHVINNIFKLMDLIRYTFSISHLKIKPLFNWIAV
jgi:hypothetical protein